MRNTKFAGLVFALVVSLVSPRAVLAATISVNSTNDPAGFNGAITVGTLGGTVTLRDAVNAANNTPGDDTIVFNASLNGATIGLGQTSGGLSALTVTSVVSIAAVGGSPVTLSCINGMTQRVFTVGTGASLALTNVTIANGLVVPGQGGGGIYNNGNLRMELCTLRNNSAGSAASVGFGGGIYNNGSLVLIDSTIQNCIAGTRGGGIYNLQNATLSGCTIMSNLVAGYDPTYGGGAICAISGTMNLTNCTIANNSDVYVTGGIRLVFGSTVFSMVNCTVAGNSGNGINNIFGPDVYGRNCIVQPGSAFGYTASSTNNFDAPILGPPAPNGGPTYTCALLPSSFLAGKGIYDATVTTDQRGTTRNNPPDPGAYEMVPRSTLLVSTTTDENNGTTDPAVGAGTSLREALTLATSLGGTQPVAFAASLTSTGAVTITLTNVLPVITNAVIINGAGANLLTVSGGNAYRVFYVNPGASLSVTGMTIANGRVDNTNVVAGSGAGIFCGGILALTDCTLTNNFAGGTNRGHAGAIYAHGTSLSLLRCSVASNLARGGGSGGAIYVDSGSASIQSSAIVGNRGVNGGGIYQNGSSLFLSICSIYNNTTISNGYGGGLFAESGTVAVERSAFAYNTAGSGNGGAIANLGATFAATNCTLAYNNADNGGAIIHYGAPLTLVHCSVLYNSADFTGGGIERVGRVGNTFSLLNTLVGGNNAPTGPDAYSYADINNGTFATLGNNLIGDASGMLGLTNGVSSDLINVPPHTLAFQNNGGPTETIAFSPYSAAINGAAVVPDLNVDQRGATRSVGGAPDIGAYEDPTGDDDYDNDSLSNPTEGLQGSSSFALDTDGDGFNDATEYMAGSNPNSSISTPPKTYISRVLGYGPSRGLDLAGTFPYAFNVGTPGAAGTAGNATFTSDSAAGITVTADNEIANWMTRDFGGSAEDNVLENIYQSIRWSADPSPLTVNLANLTTGRTYKLQLLFAEPSDYNRKFDVFVEGTLIANDFNPSTAQGVPVRSYAAAAIVHEFTATDTVLNIVLTGTNVVGAADINPILQGVTLELLPMPTDPLKFITFDSETPGEFGFAFTNTPDVSFTVYGSTNLLAPLNLWSNLGPAYSSPPGSASYYFIHTAPTNSRAYYYRIRSP